MGHYRGDAVVGGNQTMKSPSARASALAFTEGTRTGWIGSDLISWMEEHLVAPRRMVVQGGRISVIREHGIGPVSLAAKAQQARRERVRTASQIPLLIAAARDRIVEALRVTVRSGETTFVNAALYAGRVSRERGPDGVSHWFVYLSEDDALSDQVLALFAADALTFPADYEHEISVCDACGAISFNSGTASRRGCAAHPYGSLDGKPDSEQQPRTIARS